MAGKLLRHLVLDNEAAQALLSTRAGDRERAGVVEAITAANGRTVVPTAVRVEVGWRRRDPGAAYANRLAHDDDPLDRARADRAVQLRRLVPTASVVDAAVAVTAEHIAGLASDAVVEVLTSDVGDLRALAAYVEAIVDVVAL